MIVAVLQHNGNTIKNHVGWPDTVFVKFDAEESPGIKPSDYDTYFYGGGGEDHVHCSDLKWGKYYLYAVGIDSSGPFRVTGGLAVKIKYSERRRPVIINIPVTE